MPGSGCCEASTSAAVKRKVASSAGATLRGEHPRRAGWVAVAGVLIGGSIVGAASLGGAADNEFALLAVPHAASTVALTAINGSRILFIAEFYR